MRTGITIDVRLGDCEGLLAVLTNRNSTQKHVWRARMVLLTAAGHGTAAIIRLAGVAKTAAWRWQARFMQADVGGLLRDKTRLSRIAPLPLPLAIAEQLVALTLGPPPAVTTHWATRATAAQVGISVSSVQRISRAHGLQPHRLQQFELSNDPHFATELRDIVGPYVGPPAHAVVLLVNEKSQIQALDGTQSGLPLERCSTMTHN
jgi:hypothetical protein